MGGFILLLLIVVVVVFVVPAVALAKASQALRAIEGLRERLRMLETRPQAARGRLRWCRPKSTHS